MKKTLFPNLFSLTSVALTLALALSSCSWLGLGEDDEDVKEEMENKLPADEMYKGAEDLLDKGKAIKAIEQFQEVERLYPFSQYANKAKVMEAYAQYLNEEYDKAIDVVDEFVSLNPGNEEIEFMYYLKAICYYDRIQDVKRDQEVTRRAQSSFEELINRFPQSKYARDAQYKLDLIRDHLAAKDMEVGRFYMKQKNYIAALNRFKDVVKNYDTTQQIEEAPIQADRGKPFVRL
jgi:outer membrane protein assembly factor BamD